GCKSRGVGRWATLVPATPGWETCGLTPRRTKCIFKPADFLHVRAAVHTHGCFSVAHRFKASAPERS
ncbi:MAG: hypothetical protein ACP5MD_02950, partial [Verrucomicrobiia bacterium]